MWLSRKINSIIKHKSSITSFYRKRDEHISFVLGITSGTKNTGKSSLIKGLALDEIYDETHIIRSNNNRDGKLYRLKNNEQFIIQIIECNGIPSMELSSLDGIFICYDVTNRDSMDSLPDITNTFIANQVPCLLIGLKSDLTVLRTVDPQLGHLIGNLFGVQAIEVDNFTFNGTQLLQKYFIQFIYSDRKILLNTQQLGRVKNEDPLQLPSSPKTPAPTMDAAIAQSEPVVTTFTTTTTAPIITAPQPMETNKVNNITDEESIETIIDRLLNSNQDEHGTIIFLTVFRKFMKPSNLANILIQRFEFDLINQEYHFKSTTTTEKFLLPTTRQERIRSFFCIWLSHYWGDFKNSATRRVILDFLDRISNYQELNPICDVLLPLAMRDPALRDKDAYWGMCDEEQVTKRKKDSGYCDSFQWNSALNADFDNSNGSSSILLKRAASTNSHIPVALKSIVTTFNKRNSTPVSLLIQQQQQLQLQKKKAENNNNSTNKDNSAIFGGGIIPIQYDQPIMIYDHNTQFDILVSLSPTKLTEQLTWIDQELFRKIQPRDFLRHLWSHQKRKSRLSTRRSSSSGRSSENPVLASIEHFNFVSGWIASLIVDQSYIEKRIHIFEFFLQVAVELRRLNNFNTLMAVLAGVNSAAVLRLKQTRLAVQSKNKKLYDQFLELETLMSSERSFYHYRAALKQTTTVPGIPYLGIHQQDLVSLGEANKDYKANGKVHWKKFRLIGDSILQVMRFQYPTYTTLVPDSFVIYFIGHEGTVATEDERYEKSIKIEPRSLKPSPSTSSTSSRWLTKHVIY